MKTILEKDFSPLPNCGETWELSGVDGNVSIVSNGHFAGKPLVDLIRMFKGDLVGTQVYNKHHDEFPLLVKFIDANDDLSIQVHPDDALASELHDSYGKTEMWYVFQADEGSHLISGFNQEVDRDTYLKYFNEGRLTEILNKEKVADDDVFFIPAGRVHTIGKGLLVAEIQQTSDITYRIYDFDRVDDQGNKRDLHIDEALNAIDFTHHDQYKTLYAKNKNEAVNLVICPYFTTNRMHLDASIERDYSNIDSFIIYVVMEGSATLKTEEGEITAGKGEVLLIPAGMNKVDIIPSPEIKMLESFISE